MVYRLAIASLTLVLLWRAWTERWPWLKGPFAHAAFVLACLLLGRAIWDATFAQIPLDLPWSDNWAYLLGVTLVPSLAFVVVPRRDSFEVARKIAVWVGCITIFLVLASAIYVLRNAKSFGRLSTDILNPISLGQMAISCLIVVNARMLANRACPSRRLYAFIGRWLMTVVCILTVIASVSKGPILALLSVIVLGILFRGGPDRSGGGLATRLMLLAIVLSLGVGLLILIDTYTPIQVISRFADARSDTSTSTRIDLIRGALAQFNESPFFGSSFVEFTSRFYPHNTIIEAMMTNGVLGLAAFATLLFGCFYHFGRILSSFPEFRWIALLFFQYFIVSMFSGSLYFDPTIWATMLVVLGCAQAQIAPLNRQSISDLAIHQ